MSDTLSGERVRKAVAMLSDRQQQTLEAPYGVPVPLLTLLDGTQRFGNDGLPNDPGHPGPPAQDKRGHQVVRAERLRRSVHTPGDLSRVLTLFYIRAILCGLLNDGLFRDA